MKSYTNLEQSKKLAEILPLKSADMCYLQENSQAKTISPLKLSEILNVSKPQVTPCWSLAALFSILPAGSDVVKEQSDDKDGEYMCTVGYKNDVLSTFSDNPIDACVSMIEKLHELKML